MNATPGFTAARTLSSHTLLQTNEILLHLESCYDTTTRLFSYIGNAFSYIGLLAYVRDRNL
jgi:hypothetical protein